MFKRETRVESLTCPECGAELSQDRDLLHCKEHGAFFIYGPQLLVRTPSTSAKAADAPMPWETRTRRA